MARNYARILTAIWQNDEFRALSGRSQLMYLMLASQPDISAVGLLSLRVRRWSNATEDSTPDSVMAAIDDLASRRFIIFDLDTEELLVRSFTRWDGGYTNPKRRPVIHKAALDVESDVIRRCLARELQRLDLPDWLPDSLSSTQPGQYHIESDAELSSQEDTVSDSQPDRHAAEEGVVVLSSYTTLRSKPTAPTALPDGATTNQRSKLITDAYYEVEPMTKWPAINAIVIKAIKVGRWTDDAIRDGLLRMAADKRPVTVDSLRVELDGLPPPKPRQPATTLTERDGMMLSPRNIEAADRAVRMAAMQARLDQAAIEGIGSLG